MSEKTRVLVVQRILPPYRLPFFQALAQSEKIDLTLAYGKPSPGSALESIERPDGLKTIPLDNWYCCGKEIMSYQRGLCKTLLEGRYDVVIAEFNPRIVSMVRMALGKKRWGGKLIWWGHGFGPGAGRFSTWVRTLLMKRADALILYGAAQLPRFTELGFSADRIVVAPNAMDFTEIVKLRAPWENERDRVLYIGRFVPYKRVDLALRAFAQADLPDEVKLTLVGEGPERSGLETLARELGIAERCEFTGALYDEASLAPHFNRAFVSVSPGSGGLSILHSFAYGVPMLAATGEGHGPEADAMEEGRTAHFIPQGDANAMAQAMAKLYGERESLVAMSKQCAETVETRFSIGAMVTAFERAVATATEGEGA